MAIQSLYRRYRPRRFSELKGQDHVVRALRTAVVEGREGQAYLFSGPRGTGKTSTARILAKVLNCENPQDGEPCCECESCRSVERGTSYDVHELDAASNNGVDAMRDLIEKASLGTPGRHKVYILDEVHMLSKAAEAALLKTLEEPPPHVVFVLATTDPQKMSATIISRTQHLQFHLLAADTLAEHVRWVAADAGLEVSDAAIEQVLTRGGGSARDTLSALELVASTGDDGITNLALDEFVEAMIDRDAGRALTMVAHSVSLGTDPRTVTEELIGYLRNGFLSLMAPELVQLPSHRLDSLAEQAQRLGAAGLVRGIELLGTALTEMRHSPDPRVLLDVATVQLTADSVSTDTSALVARLDRIERQLADGVGPASAPSAARPPVDPSTGRAALGGRVRRTTTESSRPVESAPALQPEAEPPTAESPPPAEPQNSITAEAWENTVKPSLKGMARAMYGSATFVRSGDGVLKLSVPNVVHRGKCEQHRATVEQALSEFAATAITIELVDGGGGGDGDGGDDVPEPNRGPQVIDRPAPVGDVSSTRVDATEPFDDASGVTAVSVLPDDDDVDLDDLIDAPPESVKTPIDRLAEAFPGSELIDEAG
ncbi:MAG TPA: DNA polymerase III subunit gamma/tau [Ilumatobacteraceae bacterium]|nr:DNA polymerase III subunit gamma/tau [Ilumatobacteraceae bacterium]